MAATSHKWPGIESNPDVLNEFARKIGLDTSKFSFTDVLGLDEELLMMLPPNVLAIILLFPSKARRPADDSKNLVNDSIFFLEQIDDLQDACGTIAMIHALANTKDKIGLKSGILSEFLEKAKGLSVHERGVALLNSAALREQHCSFAAAGATRAVEVGQTDHHFVCFLAVSKYYIYFFARKSIFFLFNCYI